MANFCCSIELEPRTLKQGQLDQAREVAVGLIHKKELINEASNKFIEGLKPVAAMKETTIMMVQETNELEKEEEDYKDDKTNNENGTPLSLLPPCQCSCNSPSPIVDSPDQSKLEEPLSAPF